MKILIDMNLPPRWVQVFASAGWEAVHWSQVGEPTASDREIMAWARENGYMVFTHDLDFSALLAATQGAGPSVIQVRITAKNCQSLLIGMWKRVQGDWRKEENWISVPLQWAGGEKREYGTNKIREERNIIPHRPYYFNLGKISTQQADKFIILYLPSLAGQRPQIDAGEYCFEVTVTGEEVYLAPKYFYVIWRGGCTDNIEEVKQRFEVSMDDNPPA